MKLRNMFSLLLALPLVFAACENGSEDVDKTPEIKDPVLTLTSSAIIEVAAEGGDYEITYTLENPREGVNLTAECAAEWVTELTAGEKVTFMVAANDGDARETKILVKYDTESFEVAVKQAEKPAPADQVFTKAESTWKGNYHTLALTTDDEAVKLVADIYTYNSKYGYLYEGTYSVKNSGYSFTEGEIDYYYSYITIDGEKAILDSGTITVDINDDLTYNIVVDVKDANGRELKGSYNGAVEGMSFENGFEWVAAARNVVTDGADGRFNITFKTAGTDYADYLTLDFYAEAGATKLPEGTYTIANSTEANYVDLSTLSFTTFSYDVPEIDGGEVVVECIEGTTYKVAFRMTEKDSRRVWICNYEGEIYNMEIAVGGNELTFVSANGYYSDDSAESYVYLVADNGKQLKLGLLDLEWKKDYITPGTYTVSSSWTSGVIYSGWYGTDWNDGVGFKSGNAIFEDNGDGTYTVTVDLTLTNDEAYTGVYVGAIEGYTLPTGGGNDGDETTVALTIERAKGRQYSSSNYGVMLYTPGSNDGEAGVGQDVAYVNLDLYNLDNSLSYIAAGTYVVGGTGAGELDKAYTKIMMDSSKATAGSATFAINADKTYTITFELSFENGKTYTGSYTGAVENIELPDAGDVEPTKSGIVQATGKCYSSINYGVQLFTEGSSFGILGEGQEFAYINLDFYNLDSTISYIAEGTYVVGGTNPGELDKAYTKISYEYTEKLATDGWVTFTINEDKTYTITFDLNFEDGKNVADSFTGHIEGITVE